MKDCILKKKRFYFLFKQIHIAIYSLYMLSLYIEIEVSQNMVKTDLVSSQRKKKPTLPQKNPMYPF